MARRYGSGSSGRGSAAGGRKGQIKSGQAVQYAIKDSDGNTKYLGTTNNPRRRAAEHRDTGKLGAGDKMEVQTRAVSRGAAESVERGRLASHRNRHGGNPEHNATNDGKFHR